MARILDKNVRIEHCYRFSLLMILAIWSHGKNPSSLSKAHFDKIAPCRHLSVYVLYLNFVPDNFSLAIGVMENHRQPFFKDDIDANIILWFSRKYRTTE